MIRTLILYYHMLTFNAKLKFWWKDAETSSNGKKIERVLVYGFNQIFSNPTHLLQISKQNLNNHLHGHSVWKFKRADNKSLIEVLTIIWLGFLAARFGMGG